jgi:hypothetical protein
VTVSGYRGADESVEWQVLDESALEAVLQTRDDRGGNAFYCTVGEALYPCLAIEVSGELAAIHYFPDDGAHAGSRCLATAPGLDPDGMTTLVFSLCDPRSLRWLGAARRRTSGSRGFHDRSRG